MLLHFIVHSVIDSPDIYIPIAFIPHIEKFNEAVVIDTSGTRLYCRTHSVIHGVFHCAPAPTVNIENG